MKDYTSNPKCAIEVSLNPGICTVHPDQALKFYCYNCDQTICVECALLYHPRGEHHFDSISKVIVAEKDELLKTATSLGHLHVKLCEVLNKIAANKRNITCQHEVNGK